MKQKELFNKALSDALNNYPFSDEETVMKHIRERAKNMKTEENFRQANFREITVEHYEPKKSTRIIHAFAGIAGTAAVLTGAVFGLNWLNEHGGLKDPDVQSAGAGYHANTYFAETKSSANSIDISELAGKTLKFSDFTAKIISASFDGSYMRVDYEGTCETSYNRNTLLFEPQSSGYGNGLYDDMAIFGNGNGSTENSERFTIIKRFFVTSGESIELIPAYYPDRRPIERINDLSVTVTAKERRTIEQGIESEDMEIAEGLLLPMLHISPNMIEIDPKTDDCALLNEKPSVTALRKDGTQVELLGVTLSASPSYFGADHYGYSGQYFYITPDPSDGDLTEMKAFIVNGKMYAVTAEPVPAATTTILDNGEIAEYVITSTTAAENAPEESESDTTTSHAGYYEGEEALDILKQYAGEDYCFPLEEPKTDVKAYRTRGQWTDKTYGTWTADETRTGYSFDIPAEKGEPILAVTGGTVIEIFSENVPVNGDYIYSFITIQAADGRKWRYDHIGDYYVSEGDTVKAGDKIAAVGTTGGGTPLVDIYFPDSEKIDPTNNISE